MNCGWVPAGLRWCGIEMGAGCAPDAPQRTWHSFVFISPSSVAFELKPGPYDAGSDKEFAAWAPEENTPDAADTAHWLAIAPVGSAWTDAGSV